MNNQLNNNDTSPSNQTIGDVLSGMIQQLESGNSTIVGQIKEIGQSTTSSVDRVASAVVNNSQSSSGSSVGKDLLNAFNPLSSTKGTNILSSLFLGPLWKGLFSLFSGGGDSQPAPLTKYAFPEDTRTDVAASLRTDGQASGVRSDSLGLAQSTPVAQAPIQISIQALDARSILDRSDDIAAALKQAMLSNHEINDNLNEI